MIDASQFREYIVRPALQYMEMHSEAAENLIMGTAAQESHLTYIHQLDGGPALGFFQMEPRTHDDIWVSYIAYRAPIRDRLNSMLPPGTTDDNRQLALMSNLFYATAMCRVHYRRVPASLPDADDIQGMAEYWKQYYNTPLGKGTVEEFVNNYEKVAP